jgi:hypothetical protein
MKWQAYDVDEDGMVEVELEDTGEVIRVEARFLEQVRFALSIINTQRVSTKTKT